MSWQPSVFRLDGVFANDSLFLHSQENPGFLDAPGFYLLVGQVEQQVGERALRKSELPNLRERGLIADVKRVSKTREPRWGLPVKPQITCWARRPAILPRFQN